MLQRRVVQCWSITMTAPHLSASVPFWLTVSNIVNRDDTKGPPPWIVNRKCARPSYAFSLQKTFSLKMGGQPGQDGHPVFASCARKKIFALGLEIFLHRRTHARKGGGFEERQAPSWWRMEVSKTWDGLRGNLCFQIWAKHSSRSDLRLFFFTVLVCYSMKVLTGAC